MYIISDKQVMLHVLQNKNNLDKEKKKKLQYKYKVKIITRSGDIDRQNINI